MQYAEIARIATKHRHTVTQYLCIASRQALDTQLRIAAYS